MADGARFFLKKIGRPNFGPKLSFLLFSQVWFISFPLKLHTVIACNNFEHPLEVKSTKKKFGHKFGPNRSKWHLKIFSRFSSVVFLEIAYYDIFQQYITSSRGNTHKRNFWRPKLGQYRLFSAKFCSLVFLEVAYNDSLQQCLTSSRGTNP